MLDYDLGILIPNAAITAIGAQSITAPNYLQNSNFGGAQYAQWLIHLPDTSIAIDRIRPATTLTPSSGLLTQGGAAYNATTQTIGTQTIELWRPYQLRPDVEVLNAINQALEFIFWPTAEPFSLAPDAAMREVAFASWGTLVNATALKLTTANSFTAAQIAARTFSGIQGAEITNTSANGYQPTVGIPVTPQEAVTVAAISRRQSGTGPQMQVFGQTNGSLYTGALIGTAITHTNSTFQFMWENITIPPGCISIEVRLGGVGSADVTDWDSLWVYRPNARERMFLPSSYLDEGFKFDGLSYSPYHMSLNVGSGILEAASIDPSEIPRADYSSNVQNQDANPSYIQFHGMSGRNYPTWPMWIQMRLPYSERGLYTTEASTTNAPLHLLAPAAAAQLFEPAAVQMRIPNGDQLYQRALSDSKTAGAERPAKGPAHRGPLWSFASLRN